MMTKEEIKEMTEAMAIIKRVCSHSESCIGCPFDKYGYCDCEQYDETVTPDRWKVEE